MRILFVANPLVGHVNTMLPLILAGRAAGHDVVLATGAAAAPLAQRHGLETWAVGPPRLHAPGELPASWLACFADAARNRLFDLLRRAAAWQPQIVIHEETELAGAVVAARTGAMQVVHGLGVMPPAPLWGAFVDALQALGERADVPGVVERLAAATYLTPCPPALRNPDAVPWRRVLPLRPAIGAAAAGETLPASIGALPGRPLVHVTLGTIFGSADVLQRVLEGLRELPLAVVATSGPDVDPARLGAQPPHVVVERYVPHALLLPHCRLVVGHGGAGVMLGALAHGLPQLVLPQGADQFINAMACSAAGAGLVLQPGESTAERVAAAVQRLLGEPRFRAAAGRVQQQIAAMPLAGTVLGQLTELR